DPVEGGRSLDAFARHGAEQRTGCDKIDLALRPVCRRVDAGPSVLVLAADEKTLIEEAGRSPVINDALALAFPARRAQDFNNCCVTRLPPSDLRAAVPALHADGEDSGRRSVVLEGIGGARHVAGVVGA